MRERENESGSSNKRKIEQLERQEVLNVEDAKARKQAIIRESHTLNGMEEEKALPFDSSDSILSRTLQKAITERDTLHANVLDDFNTFQQHLLNELRGIKNGAVTFATQHVCCCVFNYIVFFFNKKKKKKQK
ncbi:hypothetical protein RFI_24235 [Reticulomyxa filosa]|uniref:Uncharacterized protein n=1 Tax=Reticulomyxa filosa TaxID=46433 RepID=X6MJ92_RETFI|nr:hypothetical protein RFI_24235 [Reticulomyxa filosa]|eukprot:ETO13140.1 hypothetical protein RFI_24235 [Reticulomyxa filosa]